LENARILVVDDDQEVLQMMKDWLSLMGSQVDTAVGGLQGVSMVKQKQYDVVITDLQMPGVNGLQLLAVLKEIDPLMEVVFLSGQGTMDDAIQALRGGKAFDFLKKPLRDFDTLARVLNGALAKRASQTSQVQSAPHAPTLPAHMESLSPREFEIMQLLAEGIDNRTIADRLFLSEKTVRNQLTRIYEKLGVTNRTQAVLACKRYGIIS
jgi:DNA-binding NarL/FixJ family response regulator